MNNGKKDWIQVGDSAGRTGWSHNKHYGYPLWGDGIDPRYGKNSKHQQVVCGVPVMNYDRVRHSLGWTRTVAGC